MRKLPAKTETGGSHPQMYEDSGTSMEPGLSTLNYSNLGDQKFKKNYDALKIHR